MDVAVLPNFMAVDKSRAYIDMLYSNDAEKCFEAVNELKFSVIGSVREKGAIIEQGVVARLLQMLKSPETDVIMKTEITTVLNSLAKGLPDHAAALVQAGLLPVLWEQLEMCGTLSCNATFTQMLLCCLRSVYLQGCAPPPPSWNPKLLSTLIQFGYSPPKNQECVANILASACRTSEQQQQLIDSGCAALVACMLSSPHSSVQLPALHCLAALCWKNERVSASLVSTCYGDVSVPDLAVCLMRRDRPHDMQLAACRALTYLHRTGAISADDPRIIYKSIQCLIHLCRRDCAVDIRVEAATVLSYLIEVDLELQRTAHLTDKLISVMTEFLKYQPDSNAIYPQNTQFVSSFSREWSNKPCQWSELMLEAGLKVCASLSANDEDIRKRVIDTDFVMKTLLTAINSPVLAVQLAAVRSLHSLSRSVKNLRTTFQDHMVWKPLMNVLKNSSCEDLILVTSSTLCNLLLVFSPSKENILDQGGVELLCGLTRRPHTGLRLNAVWALMNMTFQAEYRVKASIMHHLTTDQIFRLLSEADVNVLMKTLGLLRNLLSPKSDCDQIMQAHGKEIMQAIILILEGEHCAEVKEQALCVLGNIADGDVAKSAIMSNEDVLKKLMNYMVMPNVDLQSAATVCITNLVWDSPPGALERQKRLREMEVDKILESLLSTTDKNLFDKVKAALEQFKITTWRSEILN